MRTRSMMVLAAVWAASLLPAHSQPRQPAAQPLPPQSDWFLATGDWHRDPQLFVREFGEGTETVIALHGGWGAEHSGLVDAVRHLGKEYHFVLYDQRGSLRSPAPDGTISYDRFIEDLEALRAELGLQRLNLLAHSMGAVLASAYAAKYPDRVQRLILVAPAYLKYPVPKEDHDLRHQGYEAAQAYAARPEVQQELERYGLTRSVPALSSREETARYRIDLARRMLHDVKKWPLLSGGRATFNRRIGDVITPTYPPDGWNFFEHFSRGGYPVTLIAGDHDFLDFGAPLLRKWTSGIAYVRLKIIENAGHLIWIDQQSAFTRAVRDAMQATDAPAGMSD
jgi:proline iminopeptidase